MAEEDSPSDWDSMSESGSNPKPSGAEIFAGEPSFPKKFEITNSKVELNQEIKRSIPGKAKPSKPDLYQPVSPESAKDVKSQSVALAMISKGKASKLKKSLQQPQDSFDQTSTVSSQNSVIKQPITKSRQENFEDKQDKVHGEGIDNPGFNDECSFTMEENIPPSSKNDQSNLNPEYPQPDESIQLWIFEPPCQQYLKVNSNPREVYADKYLNSVIQCTSFCLSEIFGFLKIPLAVLVLILGKFVKFLIDALMKPLSDFLLKPLMVSVHNLICLPLCGLWYNFCSLTAQSLKPFCGLRERKTEELS